MGGFPQAVAKLGESVKNNGFLRPLCCYFRPILAGKGKVSKAKRADLQAGNWRKIFFVTFPLCDYLDDKSTLGFLATLVALHFTPVSE